MELGHQSPALLINAASAVTSDVSLVDERDCPAVQRGADPFRVEGGLERRVRDGRNDDTFQDLADTTILHGAGLCPAPDRFLWSLFLVGFLCAEPTRRADQQKNEDPSPHR